MNAGRSKAVGAQEGREMVKKTIALAMTVGVMAGLALPASASASWKHHATEIQQNVTLNFTGNTRFQGGLGGIECQLTKSLLFKAGQTTGTVEQFKPDNGTETEKCKGLGGLSPCQIHNLTPQFPNWVFHTITVNGQPKIQVTQGDITFQMTGGFFCLVKHVTITPVNEPNHFVTLIPNQPNTFTSFQEHGQLELDLQTNGGAVHKETVTFNGVVELESGSERHTYSI